MHFDIRADPWEETLVQLILDEISIHEDRLTKSINIQDQDGKKFNFCR